MFTRESLLAMLMGIPGLLLAISLHEAAHGYAAYFMGDHTAKSQGRLSLNPLRHLDPIGALCMLLFHFGWAKPVPINPQYFRHQRLGVIVVSLAGPFANFFLGFICALIYYAIILFMPYSDFAGFLVWIFSAAISMNVGLMLFNLIPIPPLDGSKVLMEFLPWKAKMFMYRSERYFGLILMILVYVGTLTPVLSTLQQYVLNFYSFLCEGIYGLFI